MLYKNTNCIYIYFINERNLKRYKWEEVEKKQLYEKKIRLTFDRIENKHLKLIYKQRRSADNAPNTTFLSGVWGGVKSGFVSGTISGIGAAATYSIKNKNTPVRVMVIHYTPVGRFIYSPYR